MVQNGDDSADSVISIYLLTYQMTQAEKRYENSHSNRDCDGEQPLLARQVEYIQADVVSVVPVVQDVQVVTPERSCAEDSTVAEG